MTKSTRARYTLEFKEEAVRPVTGAWQTVGDRGWFGSRPVDGTAGVENAPLVV
jgi:hypothetical protein